MPIPDQANDTIIRMVRISGPLRASRKQTIIGRTYGYHGSTIMSASMGMTAMHEQAATAPILCISSCLMDFCIKLQILLAASWLEDKINEIGADQIAAFIAEPIRAGGVIVLPEGI